MGTRADFYVGRGPEAEWLGSIAWDGYPAGISKDVLGAASEEQFRDAVRAFAAERKDWTDPKQGWPWPWEDSRTTDYAYALDGGKVWVSCFGHSWQAIDDYDPEKDDADDGADGEEKVVFPNMKARMRIAWGDRSGLIVISGGKILGEKDMHKPEDN